MLGTVVIILQPAAFILRRCARRWQILGMAAAGVLIVRQGSHDNEDDAL